MYAATDGKYALLIMEDSESTNPRKECDNLGEMICWHDRYNLGDEHDYDEPGDFIADMKNMAVMLPLCLYDHSGLSISTCKPAGTNKWDTSLIGWICMKKDAVLNEFGDTSDETIGKVKEILQAEIDIYNLYLSGECYGYKLFENGEEIDSCWGFLGEVDDLKESFREHLPDACASLVDELEYTPIEEYEYLYKTFILAAVE